MHTVTAYLRYLLRSTNHHGVHSPFVFDLVTKCFYDRTKYAQYALLNDYRKALLDNREFIEVTDFGAGSKVFRSNTRQISKIAKTAGITSKNAQLLFRLTRYFKPDSVLEIGTSLGLATSAIAMGNPDAKITTIEGCAQTAGAAQLHLQKWGMASIEFVVSEFAAGLSDFRHSAFDLVYFDGNHQKDATLHYFDLLLPTATNDSVWIFDDIHWSADMEAAWETIKKHPRVTVTIDTFQWGLVFFRTEQRKQDFVIRA